MKDSSRRRRAVAAIGVVALLGALVSMATAATPNPQLTKAALGKLRGTITADGSSTVGPYTTAAAELFRRAGASKTNITVGISGTGGGFERFCKGETDLSDASRPMRLTRGHELQDQQHRLVAGIHGGERRAHGRRQP